MCGSATLNGFAFSTGLELSKSLYKARIELQSSIKCVPFLMRGSVFRPRHIRTESTTTSLDICPLGDLIDIVHTHQASRRHDKVYALLGMASDNLSTAGMFPDYSLLWKQLLQRLVNFLLSEQTSVRTWDDREMAVINSTIRVVGHIGACKNKLTPGTMDNV
jgi:hypothetical protein